MEPFMTTYTGISLNPLELKPEEVKLLDVAHHLSMINRFGGAARRPVTVAQHSVYVSRLCDGTGMELLALLHDGSEAYLGDVTKWVKMTPTFDLYRVAEWKAQSAVNVALGALPSDPDMLPMCIKKADRLMVRFEAKMVHPAVEREVAKRHQDYQPVSAEEIKLIGPWEPWHWMVAKSAFLTRFYALTNPEFKASMAQQMELFNDQQEVLGL